MLLTQVTVGVEARPLLLTWVEFLQSTRNLKVTIFKDNLTNYNNITNLASSAAANVYGRVLESGDLKLFENASGSIVIPTGTTTISTNFQNNTNITSFEIPETVTTIPNDFANGCTNVTQVTLSGTPQLATLGERAFKGCTSLDSITLPASLVTINTEAFKDCSNLNNIDLGNLLAESGVISSSITG